MLRQRLGGNREEFSVLGSEFVLGSVPFGFCSVPGRPYGPGPFGPTGGVRGVEAFEAFEAPEALEASARLKPLKPPLEPWPFVVRRWKLPM